jgi:hypothetical protein
MTFPASDDFRFLDYNMLCFLPEKYDKSEYRQLNFGLEESTEMRGHFEPFDDEAVAGFHVN